MRIVKFTPRQGTHGESIELARHARGMTKKAVAEAVGVNPRMYAQWEAGKRFPTRDQVEKLAEVLRCLPQFFRIAHERIRLTHVSVYDEDTGGCRTIRL